MRLWPASFLGQDDHVRFFSEEDHPDIQPERDVGRVQR